mmetsp:Transcript_14533/g.31622  ORF Transcript_14533/g.31622 Transcript_14533/m.31622 type:complete len:742 (+) Transcript_14533:174-2399(+)|eukprot:CAMPEP_0202895616 /NCGR_PEP_ID=MMETSP1392-20130828/4770_1 /ASSEMBLY_ACC=CAM_ASM_000868 /TAXON_ID=225041 /ORGANISM="Chlamydomonas chlamydogama, Strain SAG 11-48b" /LENGTH=741 /DNA_ID=CAMNT_0049580677 /DNA_START=129 /DNA_END=2354 /DNA_ORIENTATION=+
MDPQSKQEAKYKAKSIMGILSDKMDVANAKLRGEDSDIEVAIVKATLNDEVVPKEKHVRTLKIACAGSAPRQQVEFVIHGLGKRLEQNKAGWLVTLKTLIVFHRLMREVDPSFQEQMLRFGERTGFRRMLRLESFADHTTKDTWDLSAWIRVYSVYLDERLEVFRVMKFDPEQEDNSESKLKACSTPELLERLPLVQKLLGRLIACVPQGAAQGNEIVVQACGLVLREVRAVYKAVCEGVMNLADKFFEMERGDALKGLELYKENMVLNDRLNTFFSTINNIGSLRGSGVTFPTLQSLPPDFLTTLEEYVKDAPKAVDPNNPGAANRKSAAPPPALTTSATFARQGGTTSTAIGGAAPPATTTLQVGAPVTSPPHSPQAAAAPTDFDLLGADLSDLAVSSPSKQQQQPPAAVGAAGSGFFQGPPPAAAGSGSSFFNGQAGWAAAAGAAGAPPSAQAAGGSAFPAQPQQAGLGGAPPAGATPGFNPFGGPDTSAAPPYPHMNSQPGSFVGQAPGATNPFGAAAVPPNAGAPPPAAAAPAASNPFGMAAPFAPPPAHVASHNPFGAPAAFAPAPAAFPPATPAPAAGPGVGVGSPQSYAPPPAAFSPPGPGAPPPAAPGAFSPPAAQAPAGFPAAAAFPPTGYAASGFPPAAAFPPAAPAPGASFPPAAPGLAYGAPAPMAPAGNTANPFAVSAWPTAAPLGGPGASSMTRNDPLNDLTFNLLGKTPGQQPVPPSLNQLKGGQ